MQFFSIGTKADLNYTFQNYLKAISIDGIFSIRTYLNTEIQYTYDWDIFKNYLGRDYRNVGKSELSIRNNPSESFSLMIRSTFGKDLAYNEEKPDVGREFTLFIMPSFQLGDKLNLSPSIRYATLSKLIHKKNILREPSHAFPHATSLITFLALESFQSTIPLQIDFLFNRLFSGTPILQRFFMLGEIKIHLKTLTMNFTSISR